MRITSEQAPVSELERVYREQGPKLYHALLLFTGDPEVASDAVAEAFVQALARGDELRAVDRWVWKTAYMVAAGEMKRRSTPAVEGPERSYEIPYARPLLSIAMRELSPKQRASVALHDYAGYSLRETAKMIGSTASAVSVHLVRAHTKLRRYLEEIPDE